MGMGTHKQKHMHSFTGLKYDANKKRKVPRLRLRNKKTLSRTHTTLHKEAATNTNIFLDTDTNTHIDRHVEEFYWGALIKTKTQKT
jgi:hypothetical protein